MNKKIVLLFALVATLILVFVACNTDSEPVDTTVTTEAATEATVETTEAPAETTEAPAETTEAPAETTEAPAETTEAPAETTEAPAEETTAEPETEAPDNSLNIDLTTVVATGSWPTVDVPVNGAALGLTGGEHVIALHYGSINLGEMDLSQYSKVTVTYVTPCGTLNGSDFNAEYEATGKRVLLLNAPSAVQEGTTFEYLPADDAIITSTHYEISGSANQVMTVEIDLTEVTHNGQTYLTFDARNAENGLGAIGYLVYVVGISFS